MPHSFDGAYRNCNLIEETLPDGTSESWTCNLTFNEVTSYTDPMGRVTDYALDPSTGNVLSVTQVGTPSRVTTYTYTPRPTGQGQTPGGLLATEADPRAAQSGSRMPDVGSTFARGSATNP